MSLGGRGETLTVRSHHEGVSWCTVISDTHLIDVKFLPVDKEAALPACRGRLLRSLLYVPKVRGKQPRSVFSPQGSKRHVRKAIF